MGFLADVGRSGGVGQLGQGFLSSALQAGQFTQQAETNELAKQKAQMEIQQMEKDNKEYQVDAAASVFPEEHRDTIKKMWTMSGLVDPNGIIVGKNVRKTPELYKQYPDMALATNMVEIDKIEKEQKSLQKKGDPDSQKKIMENADILSDLYKKNALIKGKEKVGPVLIPKGTQGTMDPTTGVVKPLPEGMGKTEGKVIGYTTEGKAAMQSEEGGQIVLADGQTYDPTVHGILSQPVGPKEGTSPLSQYMTEWTKLNPNATPQQKMTAITDFQKIVPEMSGKARAEVWKEIAGDIRQTPVYDKESGSITFATANEIKASPDRYAPPGAQQKVQGQQMLIQDIKGQIGRTATVLTNMRSDFSPDQRAQIVLVLKHRDPGSAWSNFMGSNWASTLSDDQKDYVVTLLQLKEQAMAMRSVLGAGQGSDMLREAIDKTLPGMISPDRKFALKQLNEFNQTMYRLERYVPKGVVTPGVEQPAPLDGGTQEGVQIAPAGTKAKLPNGSIVTSDGKGGWK